MPTEISPRVIAYLEGGRLLGFAAAVPDWAAMLDLESRRTDDTLTLAD